MNSGDRISQKGNFVIGVQKGTAHIHGVSQSLDSESQQQKLQELLLELKRLLPNLPLDELSKEDAATYSNVLLSMLRDNKMDSPLVPESGKLLHRILEGIAGNAVWDGFKLLLPLLQRLFVG